MHRPTKVEVRLLGSPADWLTFEGERCLWHADDFLRQMAKAAPKRDEGEPDRWQYIVTFGAAPVPFHGTFYLHYEHRFIFDRGLLATDMYEFLTFMANFRKPDHLTDEEWETVQAEHVRRGWASMAQAMLDQIDLSRQAVRNYRR